MAETQAAILRPETLVEEFKKNRVTHVVTIPDSETNYLYELMLKQPWLDVVPAAREGVLALGAQVLHLGALLGRELDRHVRRPRESTLCPANAASGRPA